MRKHNLTAAHAARSTSRGTARTHSVLGWLGAPLSQLDSRDGVRRDHRNGAMLQKFLIEEYIGGQNGVDNSAIDGLFIDDGWSR